MVQHFSVSSLLPLSFSLPFNFFSSFSSPPSFYAAVRLSSFFFLFFFPSFPLLVLPILSFPHFSPCHPTFHPNPSTFISSSSPSLLLVLHVFPLHYTLSSTLPSPLKFVSVLPLVTSLSLCPPQHGSRRVEQSWRGVAGSRKHRRRH